MTHDLPSRAALKTQAKHLRADLSAQGTEITHARSLEMIAHQHGLRDWNTAAALAGANHPPGWAPGQRVTGQYLGHPVQGVIRAAAERAGGYWQITVRFDAPVDVVSSARFSNLRRQVNATLNADGVSPQKTSDGVPHLVLHAL